MGDTQKHAANLTEIVQSVIEMVRPLSKFRGRHAQVPQSTLDYLAGQLAGNETGCPESDYQRT